MKVLMKKKNEVDFMIIRRSKIMHFYQRALPFATYTLQHELSSEVLKVPEIK